MLHDYYVFSKALKLGAALGFGFSGFFVIISSQTFPPMKKPLLNVKFLPTLFIGFGVALTFFANWDSVEAIFALFFRPS